MTSNVSPGTLPVVAPIRTEMRGGVLLAVIDMPGRSMNVFSWDLMDAFEALIDRLESDHAVGALVLTSGKSSFLAGADLDMVRRFTQAGRTMSREAIHEMCGRLGRLFVRMEAILKPSVAAINGLALGGGLEVTMACHRRLVADDPRIQLGLPEIKLGLLPGAGGTQRLPRLIGIEKGLEFLLSGRSMTPAEAQALGLIDAVVPAGELVDRAVALAADLARNTPRGDRMGSLDAGPFDLDEPDVVRRLTRHFGYADAVTEKYPAYDAIVQSTIGGARLPVRDGGEIEMACFVDLMQNEVAGNMVSTLFLERQKADKIVNQFTDLKGVRFAVKGDGECLRGLGAALAAAKATIVEPSKACENDVRIGSISAPGPVDIRLIERGSDRVPDGVGVFVRRSTQYGTAMEIVEGEAQHAKALALARQLRATPYVHAGSQSLLATLTEIERRGAQLGLPEEAVTTAQALAAQRLQAAGIVGDSAAADMACVVSGVFPAFAGGPFTFLSQCSAEQMGEVRRQYAAQAADLFAAE